MGVVIRLKIGERFFAALGFALLLEEEDRQGTEQAQIARGRGVPNRAVVLALGAITPMMLAIFNAPVLAGYLEQPLGSGFLGRERRHGTDRLVGFFVDLAFAQVLSMAMDAADLSDARQAQGGGIGRRAPELAQFNSPVPLIQRAGLRGEGRRAAVARLWPAPWAGWL